MCDNKMIQTVEDASAEAPKKVEACEAGADRCCRKDKRCCKKDKKCRKGPEFECEWDNMRPPKPCGRRFRKRMMRECIQEECNEDGKYKVSAKEFEEFKAWQERHKNRGEWMGERKKNKMLRHGRCHPHRFWRQKMGYKMMGQPMPQPMKCGPCRPQHPRCHPCDPRRMMMLMWMRKMMSQQPYHKGWGGHMPPHHPPCGPHHHCRRQVPPCDPRRIRHPCPPCFGWGPRPCNPWQQWECPPQKPHGHHFHHHGHHGHHGHWGMPPQMGFNQWRCPPTDFGWQRGHQQWW